MLQMVPLASFYAASLWFWLLSWQEFQTAHLRSASKWRLNTLTRPDVQSSTLLCFCHPADCRSSCCCEWTSSSSEPNESFSWRHDLRSYSHKEEKWRPVAFPSQISIGLREVPQNFWNRTVWICRGSVGFCSGIKRLKTRICPSVPVIKQHHLLA